MDMSNESSTSKGLMNVAKDMKKKYQTVEEPEAETMDTAWDDVSGVALDPKQVRRARAE